jgi:hypothetical protein
MAKKDEKDEKDEPRKMKMRLEGGGGAGDGRSSGGGGGRATLDIKVGKNTTISPYLEGEAYKEGPKQGIRGALRKVGVNLKTTFK